MIYISILITLTFIVMCYHMFKEDIKLRWDQDFIHQWLYVYFYDHDALLAFNEAKYKEVTQDQLQILSHYKHLYNYILKNDFHKK